MIVEATKKVVERQDLTAAEAEQVMDEIMSGEAEAVNMAAFLTALRMKGETVEEITAFAKGMRKHGIKVPVQGDVLEIVGTGGDEANSINISTTASILVAAAGYKVAKHGNRSVSSKSGAADCLEALGVKLDLEPEQNAKVLEASNICFMFAQKYHSAMRFVGPVRKALGIRTVFNILGPLANPAEADVELLGVYSEELVEPMAHVLDKLGVKRALVVYGQDRLDEISLSAPTTVMEVNQSTFTSYELTPAQFGMKRCDKSELVGGDGAQNAQITESILKGECTDAKAEAVILNAGAGIYLMGGADSIAAGIQKARETIANGKAYEKLQQFVALTNMILDDLAAATRARVERKMAQIPLETVKEQALNLAAKEGTFTFPFEQAIAKEGISFICEVKKASPSKGIIAEDFPYLEIAREYEKAGADCISVLTETDYFKGEDRFLREINDAVQIPTIRKDFIIDEYMIYEAKLLGASCVLLIAALLDTETIRQYKAICDQLGLSALVEAHDEAEAASALAAGARMVGVNNRNLKDFTVDIHNSTRLRELVPRNVLFVAESGIKTAEDIAELVSAGVNGVLIGETLMRSPDKAQMLDELRSRV